MEGAYGSVFRCRVEHAEKMEVAVKLMSAAKDIHDRCVLYDIFTEILILDRFKSDPRSCVLYPPFNSRGNSLTRARYDFGIDKDQHWVVLKLYKSSLKAWRVKQTKPLSQNLPLLINVFTNFLNRALFLAENRLKRSLLSTQHFF